MKMVEYIERNQLYELGYWHGATPTLDNPFPDGVDAVDMKDIDSIPAADVREVKRGKWICDGYWSHGCGMGEEYGNYWKCSVCDKIVQEDYAKCGFHYCPYCGADMRGGA